MRISSTLPKHSALNRAKFRDNGASNRLSLAITHVVSGYVGGKERIGESKVIYNLDFMKKVDFSEGFVIDEVPLVGIQSTDLVNRIIEEMRPRTSYAVAKVSSTAFDMRSLCFTLGHAAAAGVGNADITVHSNPSSIRALSTGWNVPDYGEVIFGPEVCSTPKELATLTSLTGAAGIKTITLLRDDIPGLEGFHMVGRDLACYAYKVVASILQSAHEAMCFGAHMEAFQMGKNMGMRLAGHTDEAGWIRNVFSNATFPRPTGYVCPTGTHFLEYPLQERIDREDIMRVTIGDYLEFVALFPVADVLVHGAPSIVALTDGDGTRTRHYDLLQEALFKVMACVRSLLCDLYGVHEDANSGNGILKNYISRDPIDRHFGGIEALLPFFYVEPSPLLTKEYPGYHAPAMHGKVTKMPLFGATSVEHHGNVLDSAGRAMPGTKTYIKLPQLKPRETGFFYLMSSKYSVDNGLGQMKYCGHSPTGTAGSEPMFINSMDLTVAENRWVTPHNPMPTPFEAYSPDEVVIEYRHVSKATDLAPKDCVDGSVESTFGNFVVEDGDSAAPTLTHRSVPRRLVRKLHLYGASTPVVTIIEPIIIGKKEENIVKEVKTPDSEQPANDTTTEPERTVHTKTPEMVDSKPPPDEEGEHSKMHIAPTGIRPTVPAIKSTVKKSDERSTVGN
jgi:hypothetical protein